MLWALCRKLTNYKVTTIYLGTEQETTIIHNQIWQTQGIFAYICHQAKKNWQLYEEMPPMNLWSGPLHRFKKVPVSVTQWAILTPKWIIKMLNYSFVHSKFTNAVPCIHIRESYFDSMTAILNNPASFPGSISMHCQYMPHLMMTIL